MPLASPHACPSSQPTLPPACRVCCNHQLRVEHLWSHQCSCSWWLHLPCYTVGLYNWLIHCAVAQAAVQCYSMDAVLPSNCWKHCQVPLSIRSDNAREHVSSALTRTSNPFCTSHLCPAYQSRMARLNCLILHCWTRPVLCCESGLLPMYWGHATITANYPPNLSQCTVHCQ